MKKLSLKKLKLESRDLLQKEQLKTVFGGYKDGFDCAYWYNFCDGLYPDDYWDFNYCMIGAGC